MWSPFSKEGTAELCPRDSSGRHIQYIQGLRAGKAKPEWRSESKEGRWLAGGVDGYSPSSPVSTRPDFPVAAQQSANFLQNSQRSLKKAINIIIALTPMRAFSKMLGCHRSDAKLSSRTFILFSLSRDAGISARLPQALIPVLELQLWEDNSGSTSKDFWRLLEKGLGAAAGATFPGAGLASNAAHLASKRSSSCEAVGAGAVSWLPSGGQLLLLLGVPFCRSIMLLCGGRPLIVVDSGGVENPAVSPTTFGAPE